MSGELQETPASELPTADEALGWLGRIKPAAAQGLLKDPDYREAITPAFAGFRTDAKSFTLPLVRTRLALAATKDGKLADKLRSLSETSADLPVSAPAREAKPVTVAPPPPPKPDPMITLRAERDTRRRERDTAREAFAVAQSERDSALKRHKEAEAERDEARQLAKKQAERIARLERQVAQAKQIEARLVKALNEDKVSPPPPARPHRPMGEIPETPTDRSPWPEAVRHLLDKGKWDAALALAEDVLKTDPDNLDALEIAMRAWEGRHEPRFALNPARRLLTLQTRRGDQAAASDTLLILFRLVSDPAQMEPEARMFLAALPATDSAAVGTVRLMLGRLRGLSTPAHDWLTAYISSRTTLAPLLMPPPDALGPDDPLPLRLALGQTLSARNLVEAIDRAQTALIDTARAALEVSSTDVSARVWAALELAAADDPSRLLALRRVPRGAAVVDGSNVAWFDQESLVQGMPRLRHLTAMRHALWQRGFFPVILYADANLPYSIDDKSGLFAMRNRRELAFVDAGTVADEVLLRVAKQMDAPLITNDKMEDWDPEGTVRKVRYAISMNGEAHLLSEI